MAPNPSVEAKPVTAPACQACADLRETYEINSPGQRTKAIRVVRTNLPDGTLTDITQPAHSPSGKFADLAEGGQWPDYVEHYFRCNTCDHHFRLAVDTYHGVGVEWELYVA